MLSWYSRALSGFMSSLSSITPRACSIVNYIINTSFIIYRHQLGYIPSAVYSNSLSWLYH